MQQDTALCWSLCLPSHLSPGPLNTQTLSSSDRDPAGRTGGDGHTGRGWLAGVPAPSTHPCAPQLLSESQGHMAHLVNSVSDVLDGLQRDPGVGRPRIKADLQRAPARGLRPRGCANGECGAGGYLSCVPLSPLAHTLLLFAESFLLLGSPEHPTCTLLLSPFPAPCAHLPDEDNKAFREAAHSPRVCPQGWSLGAHGTLQGRPTSQGDPGTEADGRGHRCPAQP